MWKQNRQTESSFKNSNDIVKRTRFLFIRTILLKLGIKIFIEFKDKTFHPEYLETGIRPKFYYGSWTSEKYMQDVKDDIIKLYKFPPFDDIKNKDIENQIEDNAVAIHIRRGDYTRGGIMNFTEKYVMTITI